MEDTIELHGSSGQELIVRNGRIVTNAPKRKWGDDNEGIKLHGSSGKEFVIKKERLDLFDMCEKARKKAAKTKKFKGKINKNNEKFNGDFVNNADKNGI